MPLPSSQTAFLLWSVLQSRQSFFTPYRPLSFVVDFLLNVVLPLLSITLYADSPLLLCGFILGPAIFVYAFPPKPPASRKKPRLPPSAQSTSPSSSSSTSSQNAASAPLSLLSTKPFLTTYRGTMLILTCLAILAVDFRLFPRRFAKVETWGTSLMDVGVGSFVFSAGVVAARPVLRERAEGRTQPLSRRLRHSMRHSLPLLVLGLVRLASVKGLDYNEHVSEYGVHWNFFFTLGFLPPFVAVFQSAFLRFVPSYAALALLIAAAYQLALETTPLKAFVLVAPRVDLVSMNREGLCSFWGYLAIFLAGQDTGMYVLPRSLTRSGSGGAAQRGTLLLTMAVWAAAWTGLYLAATNPVWGAGWDVSRRLANLPYVLWIAAFNTAQLLATCAVDSVFFPAFFTRAADAAAERDAYARATSPVLRAFNRNGLAVFLLANLLTGLVNLTVPTLDLGPLPTMAILVAYAAAVTAVAVALDAWDVSIKL